MTPRVQFQMYLLTKMSASGLVAQALDHLGLSEAQMRVGARAAASLDETVRMASTYERMIGPPTSDRPARPSEATGSFEVQSWVLEG